MEIKSPQQVADMGIAKYNSECRSIVMEYSGEWEVNIKLVLLVTWSCKSCDTITRLYMLFYDVHVYLK